MSFPQWAYHKEHGSKLVQDQSELNKLGKSWYDSPAFNEPVEQKPEQDSAKMSKKELVLLLQEKGVEEKELEGLNKAELLELYEKIA